jgi:hypothetical protein
LRDSLEGVYNGDTSNLSGDARVFKEQVDALRNGELQTLINNINDH